MAYNLCESKFVIGLNPNYFLSIKRVLRIKIEVQKPRQIRSALFVIESVYFRFAMSNICVICDNKTDSKSRDKKKIVTCLVKGCTNLCHLDCLDKGVSAEDWRCVSCSEQPTSLEIMKKIDGVMQMCSGLGRLEKLYEGLEKSITYSHEKIDETCNLVKSLDQKVAGCFVSIENLETENKRLAAEVVLLKGAINQCEQYSRCNSVEVHGVPEIKGENVVTTVALLLRALNVSFELADIDVCHRLGKFRVDSPVPRGIIIKFLSRRKKEEVLKARRVKKNLSVGEIDASWASTHIAGSQVYVNENLTKANRILYKACRTFKTENNVKHLWLKNGKIYMRKTDNSNVYLITSCNDFRDVH